MGSSSNEEMHGALAIWLDVLSDENNALRMAAKMLWEELAIVERSAPMISGDGKTPERSWGASYPLERCRKVLAETGWAVRSGANTPNDPLLARPGNQADALPSRET